MGDALLLTAMKTKQRTTHSQACRAPVVRFDAAVESLYVKVRRGLVAKTVELDVQSVTATCDLDASGQVIGIELIGIKGFPRVRAMPVSCAQARPANNRTANNPNACGK